MIKWSGYLLLISFIFGTRAHSQIAFAEAADLYHVDHNIGNPTIGGGVSLYDFNQDGLDDLTLGTYSNRPIGFYINTGDGFESIPPLVNNLEIVKQINWVDFDNDGDPDLYVAANEGISRLYLNQGDLIFKDITEDSGLPLDFHYGYGACWGDYNRDGWLDLYYASKGVIGDPDAIRSYNRLFKNMGDGTFIEQTERSEASDDGKLPFCAAFFDYNNDKWPDIYIANDKLTFNTLLENDGDGTFSDVSELTGANVRMNAMCVNPGDYDRDGWMDIYITNTPAGSKCLRNTKDPNSNLERIYEDVAAEVGIQFPGGNCWGSNFLDADNDGDLDLYVSSSIPRPQELSSAFYENINGAYFDSNVIEGFKKDTSSSYTNAIGDINNDGKLDIVVENNPPDNFFLWENQSTHENHWIKIDLEGVRSNRDGIGTKIETYVNVMYQMHYTHCGSGFLGQNSSYKHIGIGDYDLIDSIIITWPTGHIDKLFDVPADQLLSILEGSTTDGFIHVDDDVTILERAITTATTDHLEMVSVDLFPNPGINQFTIVSSEMIKKIEILDARGNLMNTQIVNDRIYNAVNTKLPGGLYFIIATLDQNHRGVYKWVKL